MKKKKFYETARIVDKIRSLKLLKTDFKISEYRDKHIRFFVQDAMFQTEREIFNSLNNWDDDFLSEAGERFYKEIMDYIDKKIIELEEDFENC